MKIPVTSPNSLHPSDSLLFLDTVLQTTTTTIIHKSDAIIKETNHATPTPQFHRQSNPSCSPPSVHVQYSPPRNNLSLSCAKKLKKRPLALTHTNSSTFPKTPPTDTASNAVRPAPLQPPSPSRSYTKPLLNLTTEKTNNLFRFSAPQIAPTAPGMPRPCSP